MPATRQLILIPLGIALAVAACSPTEIVLRQPKTGQIAECIASLPQVLNVIGEVESCANTYRQQGYVQQTP